MLHDKKKRYSRDEWMEYMYMVNYLDWAPEPEPQPVLELAGMHRSIMQATGASMSLGEFLHFASAVYYPQLNENVQD